MAILAIMVVATACVSVGESMLSAGMKEIGAHSPSLGNGILAALSNRWVVTGTALMMIYFGVYAFALSRADISVVLPISALSYLFVACIAKYALHEQVTPTRWLGAVIITVGVLVVAFGMRNNP